MGHINQYWERERVRTSVLYTFENYFKFTTIDGVKSLTPNIAQTRFIHNLTTNKNSKTIMYRQSGSTTALIAYAIWETFFVRSRQVNLYVCYTESAAREIRIRIKNILEASKELFEPLGVDLSQIHQDGRGGFQCSRDGNTLRVCSASSLQVNTRGLRVSSIYTDNIYIPDPIENDEYLICLDFLQNAMGTTVHQLQTGLYTNFETHLEKDSSTFIIPRYYDMDYSIDKQNDLINRYGRSFYPEYLLMREVP